MSLGVATTIIAEIKTIIKTKVIIIIIKTEKQNTNKAGLISVERSVKKK